MVNQQGNGLRQNCLNHMHNVQLQVQQKADNLNYHEVQCKSLDSQKGKTEKEKKNRRGKKESLIMTIQIFGLHMSHVLHGLSLSFHIKLSDIYITKNNTIITIIH